MVMTSRVASGVLVLVLAAVSSRALGVRPAAPPRLSTIVRGGDGSPTLILLHGYGAKAEDWLPFTRTIGVRPGSRFVFPRAPERTVPPDGPLGGRAWWRLDLEAHVPPGEDLPDLAETHPPGLDDATARVRAILHEVERRPGRVVLGGFSQGAMVASQIAFTTEDPLAALVLLSNTPIDEEAWRRGFTRRVGLPVFISHGRADPTLPFAAAERLAHELQAAGLAVTWFPFEGGHEIPAVVVTALNAFLAKQSLGPSRL